MSRRFSARLAMAVSATALMAGAAQAESATEVEEVTVTAARIELRVDEAPATVSVISATEVEDQLATDIKDLIRFEPGISVRTQPTRFSAAGAATGRDGNSGFNIRGLDGNRVLIQVDGVRVPDAYSFGPQAVGRGDYADLDLIQSVEILRGPASALYGSDGLAGAVSLATKDPVDFLTGDNNFGARARVAYSSADDGWTESAAIAGRAGDWSGLLAYTRRDASETETMGDVNALNGTRTRANPQDIEGNSLLGKLVFTPNDSHRLRLTVDWTDREVVTEAYSARTATVIDLDALDTIERTRVALDHRYIGDGLVDSFQWTLYWQQTETREWAYEDRQPAVDRIRDNTFDTEVWGFSSQGVSSFDFAGVPHRLVYGLDYSVTTQEGIRDGTVPPTGEVFPSRAFPTTDYALLGVFIQDEISLLDGALKIYPALRYDWYELDPSADALYPGVAAASEDSHLSPKISAVYWTEGGVGFFANYAQGFKAPAPSQVNNAFSNPIFGYTTIPNPDLKPETSRTVEAGIRFRDIDFAGGVWSVQTTAYKGWYEDFIEQISLTPPYPASCGAFALCFQYVNLTEVEITGFEARVEGRWDNGFTFNSAMSVSDGEDGSGAALDSVDPFKIVTGIGYRDPAGRFGGQFVVTYVGDKKSGEVSGACPDPSGGNCNSDFLLLDATAYWNVTSWATLRGGLFNITDEKYAWWSDVRGVTTTATNPFDAYTQPGRNFGISLTVRY